MLGKYILLLSKNCSDAGQFFEDVFRPCGDAVPEVIFREEEQNNRSSAYFIIHQLILVTLLLRTNEQVRRHLLAQKDRHSEQYALQVLQRILGIDAGALLQK